jgi:hypothetical protein
VIDVQMLEQFGEPCGVVIGPRPLDLEDVFARVVADGWAPRSPAFEPEITALEASHCRGDCVAPLVIAGDLAFIDRTRRAQPGDLAAFTLSARGAEAQNSALPRGQLPWVPGSPWIKLLTEYHDIPMLLDRHGHSATASLLACESPDDVPLLYPVRNILRGGRLLFTSDSHSAELGASAATTVLSTILTNIPIGAGGTNLASITVGPYPWATEVVATLSGEITGTNSSGTLNAAAWGNIFMNLTATDFSTNPTAFSGGFVPPSSSEAFAVSVERLFSLAANTTTTYYLNAINVGPSNMSEELTSGLFKIEVVKR